MALPITINDLLVKSDQTDIDLEFFNSRSRRHECADLA
jgi:hypothetical protein